MACCSSAPQTETPDPPRVETPETDNASCWGSSEEAEEEQVYDDEIDGTPFLLPSLSPECSFHSQATTSSSICAVCSRRRRSKLIWAMLLIWSVPLALATGRSFGLIGPNHSSTNQQPQGRLILTQVVFRHGARTPLSQLYYPNGTWAHCSQHPLHPSAAAHSSNGSSSSSSSDGSSSSGIQLALYDQSGAADPPHLWGDDQPQLPGGCRMGALTDTGFNMALNLGSQLRQRYLLNHKLLPAHELDLELLHAESTAFQRTVTTLRGVLTGLYPNSSAVVPVAVRQPKQEVMLREAGCPRLANLTRQLRQVQAAQDAADPKLQEFKHTLVSSLQLPPDSQVQLTRLYDELVCMTAEGQQPPAAAAQQGLLARLNYVSTQHTVEATFPVAGDCLLGREHEAECQQVTALTIGRLLDQITSNMATAAAAAAAANAAAAAAAAGGSDSSSSSSSSDLARRLLARDTPQLASSAATDDTSDGSASSSSAASPSSSSSSFATQHPKLMLFSAHDTTLMPLLSALGQQQDAWPHFASNLACELWESGGGGADGGGSGSDENGGKSKGENGGKGKGQQVHFDVRVLYNGEPLRLPLSDVPPPPAAASVGVVAAEATAGGAGTAVGDVEAWLKDEAAAGLLQVGEEDQERQQPEEEEQLRSNGQGVLTESAFVVSLDEFKQRVLQDSVLTPAQYQQQCGAVGGGGGGGRMAV